VISSLTIGIDTLTGKAGDDVFNAIDAGSAGTTATLSALDAIDGGAGTDTLNISSASAITLPTAATVTNVEKINLASASTVTLTTTTGFAGLTDLTAAGVGAITLVAAASTNVTATDTAQGAGAISITGGKAVTLTAAATDGGVNTVDFGGVTIGSATAKPAGAINATVTKTQTIAANKGSNITITGGADVTLNTTSNSGVAIAAASSTPTDDTAGVITVTPTSGAVVINSTAKNTSVTAVTVNAPSITVAGSTSAAGASTVAITQAAGTVQTATGISTVALGAVSVTGGTATTSVSVTQTAKDVDGTLAVTSGVVAAVAGTVAVTAVTASPGVTGVTAVTDVAKAAAVALVTGTPIVSNGAVTIADGNATSATVANSITAVTLANYGDSTISSTALNTLTLTGPASTGTDGTSQAGGTLGITVGGSTATIAANKTLTMNLGGGKLGTITDSSNQFSTVNANLTAATTLAGITDTALRTLNIAGTGVLTVTSLNTAVTALTVAGAAGFSGDISSNTGITSFSGSNTTAANTVTINAASQSYTGGAGVDTVTIATDPVFAISGGGGANVLKMTTSVTPTTTGMKALVSGFPTLSVSSTSGSIDMSKMPTDITTVSSTAASGGITLTKVNDGTALTLTAMASSAGSTSYTLAGTGGSTKSVTVNLGGSTTDSKNFGTIVLKDVNDNGIGTVSLVSNGVNITTGDAVANNNTVALTNTAISTLNVSGTQGLVIGATSYTDAVAALTINNTNTGSYGVSIPNLIDSSLDTLTFTGTGKTAIAALNNGSIANLTITNSGTGTASVGRIYESTSGTTDTTALTSLTLTGNVALGTKAAPVEIDTTSAAVTVSGSTDHAGVALLFAANSNATTVTLGDGNNYVKTTLTTGGGNITTGSGKDWVQQGSLGAATKSSTVSTGAGVDTIVTGPGYSSTVVTKAAGGDGADYIQVQSTGTTTYVAADGSAGKYGSVVWAGSQTTGSTVTTGSWTGTLYSESSDTITSSNVIHPTFVTLMAGSLVNANGAGKIFADANIVAPMYGQGAILVASTAKDVFLFQTENTTANDSTTAKGVAAGGSIVQNFKVGTDVIAVTNYQGYGDNLFVGTAAAASSINAVTASEALLASSNGWSWALDAGSTTAGVLTYVGAIGASTPTSANMTIRLVGIQGTITSVDSFFYQG
jgi:S-layer protein